MEAEAPEPDDCHDEGFLREHPAEQLLVPAVLLGTPVFTATPPTIPVPELVEHDLGRSAEGVEVRYSGPELRQSDLIVYGAIVAMNRGFKSTVAYRVNAEALFHITGVNPRQQHMAIRRLAQARLFVDGAEFTLLRSTDVPKSPAWTFVLGERHAGFLNKASLLAIEPSFVSSLKQPLASWLMLALQAGRLDTSVGREELRKLSGTLQAEGPFRATLRDAYVALNERASGDAAGEAVRFVGRLIATEPRRRPTKPRSATGDVRA